MRKKIAFLAPKNKGGTYYYYKGISDYLHKNHSDTLDVYFFSGYLDYLKLHFYTFDCIFSIVPFFWKPLGARKYIFNLHGNFKKEGNIFTILKTLKVYELNLWFSDNIMLVSYYLADSIGFREKYLDKIKIAGNFIEKPGAIEEENVEELKFLTVSSSSFYEKARGILDLVKVIQILSDKHVKKKVTFTIVGIKDKNILARLQGEIGLMRLNENIELIWKSWLTKEELDYEYKYNNYFLYRTYLDNFPGVILQALTYGLTCYTNTYESFPYFLDTEYTCKSHDEMCQKIISKKKQDRSFVSKYYIENVTKDIVEII